MNNINKILSSIFSCLDPFNLCVILILTFLVNPSFDLFTVNEGYCPIFYSKTYIPTYTRDYEHIFYIYFILRWVSPKSSCPLYRNIINKISYICPIDKNKTLIINSNQFKIDKINNEFDASDSNKCLICKKSEPINKLLICKFCKFNLTHIECVNIELSEIPNFICIHCESNSFYNRECI